MRFTVEINLDGCCSAAYVSVAKHLSAIHDLTTAVQPQQAAVVSTAPAVVPSTITGDSVPVDVAAIQSLRDETSVVTADPVPAKPKRKRRTKAQIAADKAAEEAAAAAEAAPVAEATTEEKKVAALPVNVAVDPLEDVPVSITQDEVKAEVVAAVGRLTADGDEAPTATVVAVLEKATGVKRVGEISPDKYHEVIAALLEVGSSF